MNQRQREYAMSRISEMAREKTEATKEKYKILEQRLSSDQKIDYIYKGKVKLRPKCEIGRYTDLVDAYDFSGFERNGGTDPKADLIINKISATLKDARDKIMLAGDTEALSAITAFETAIKNL